MLQEAKIVEDDQADQCRYYRREQVTGADGETDAGYQPETRSGGESTNGSLSFDNSAGPQKAHACDGIGGNAARIHSYHGIHVELLESLFHV